MIPAVYPLCYVFAALTKRYETIMSYPRGGLPVGAYLYLLSLLLLLLFFFKNFFFDQKYKSSHNSLGGEGGVGGGKGTKRLGAHAEYIMCEHARFTLARL